MKNKIIENIVDGEHYLHRKKKKKKKKKKNLYLPQGLRSFICAISSAVVQLSQQPSGFVHSTIKLPFVFVLTLERISFLSK